MLYSHKLFSKIKGMVFQSINENYGKWFSHPPILITTPPFLSCSEIFTHKNINTRQKYEYSYQNRGSENYFPSSICLLFISFLCKQKKTCFWENYPSLHIKATLHVRDKDEGTQKPRCFSLFFSSLFGEFGINRRIGQYETICLFSSQN